MGVTKTKALLKNVEPVVRNKIHLIRQSRGMVESAIRRKMTLGFIDTFELRKYYEDWEYHMRMAKNLLEEASEVAKDMVTVDRYHNYNGSYSARGEILTFENDSEMMFVMKVSEVGKNACKTGGEYDKAILSEISRVLDPTDQMDREFSELKYKIVRTVDDTDNAEKLLDEFLKSLDRKIDELKELDNRVGTVDGPPF